MGRRGRRRGREAGGGATSDYDDADGNVLTLRNRISAGTAAELSRLHRSPASSAEDTWQRRQEFLFERLAVRWTIAGLPLEGQRELLGRYRMADPETRRWVRDTLAEHARRHQPEILT